MLNVSSKCVIQFKAHTLPFIVRMQYRPQRFAHALLQAGRHILNPFFIRNQVDYRQKYRLFVVQLYHVCFGSIGRLPPSPSHTHTHTHKEDTWSYNRDFAEAIFFFWLPLWQSHCRIIGSDVAVRIRSPVGALEIFSLPP